MAAITEQLTTVLGDRYLIERELGQGGMALVYLARDLKHDRLVALKVLRPELAAMIGAERFLNEIKVTANLQHPHILPLHDSGEAGTFLYYVMPFVEGDTLRDKLNREKQLGIEDAIELSRAVAAALDYAHRQGVIHRDIKPENILVHDGQAMVADFGIALAVSQAGGTRLTETGLSIGTPHYMSPEQAMGDRILDARSDVYSLGAMLYEMLTGDPPHTGSTAQAIVAKVITEKAPLVTVHRDTVPRHVAAAVAKALAKLPADRFASAADFAEALIRPGAIPLIDEATAGAGARSRMTVAGWVAGALAALGLAGGFLAGRTTAPAAPARLVQFELPAPDSVVGYSRCCGRAVALSPDGSTLVFVGLKGSGGPLYRRGTGRLDAEPIPGTEGGSTPFFSPDGRWLGFFLDGRIRKVAMAGGPAVPVTEIPAVSSSPNWGDNDVIAFASDGRLFTVPAGGGVPAPVPGLDSLTFWNDPHHLPGGTMALVTWLPPGGNRDAVRLGVLTLATGAVDTIGFGLRGEYAAGYLVYAGADRTLLAQPFDPGRGRATGQAVAILDQVAVRGVSAAEFTLSASGGLAYQPGAFGANETLDLAGPSGRVEVPLPPSGNIEEPVFSPDGRRIALRLDVGTRNDVNDVWVFDRDQGTLERVTVEGSNSNHAWTPDGRRIAFQSVRQGTPGAIYWTPSDGSGSAELLFSAGYSVLPSSWLRDGRSLVFTATNRPGTGMDIGIIAVGDTVPRWLVETTFDERQPQVSPDGRWLGYTSNRSGDPEVYVQAMNGEGGRVQISTAGGNSPRWGPDGRTLYFVSNGVVVAATVAPGNEFRITERVARVEGITDLNPNNVNYDVHPGGKEILLINHGGGATTRLVWVLDWPEIIRAMGTGR